MQLLTKVDSIIQRNNITPSIAAEELTELTNELNRIKGGLDQLISGFNILSIGAEVLEPGQCEVGILIPRNAIDNKLENLKKELNELEFILKHFSEVTLGEQLPLEIRSLSSTDLNFILEYAPEAAAFLAITIERIVALYKNLLDIKKSRQDLLEKEVPEEALNDLDKHINDKMERGIIIFVGEEFDKHCKIKDNGRKNELRNSLTISMNKIANRIDKGFNFEIRVGYIEPQLDEEEGESEDSKIDKNIQIILDSQKNLEFIRTEGNPILSLSENDKSKTKSKK
jgi:hypothetical protein